MKPEALPVFIIIVLIILACAGCIGSYVYTLLGGVG